MNANCRLIIYGTLAPGAPNHHYVAGIAGRWLRGWVEGVRDARGWGVTRGYPGIICGPGGGRIDVDVLESADLPLHWLRLDAFEGPAYARRVVPVYCPDSGIADGCIYEVRASPSRSRSNVV